MQEQVPHKEPETSFRGLYKNVKISVKTLDMVIIGGIVIMLVLILYGVSNNGFTVSFDSNGGTDVQMLTDLMYGDYIPEPEPPTREGYEFRGWYTDENFRYSWDFETMQIPQTMTLYAAWEKVQP